MANNQWNDDNLNKLLHSMPKISDDRPSSEILERLKKDDRLKKDRRPKVKKWIPSIVAVAALLLLCLLLPSMLKGNQDMVSEPMMENARSAGKQAITTDSKAESASVEEDSDAESVDATTFSSMDIMGMKSHVVFANQNNTFSLNLGLIHEANVIPVTILIGSDRVKADLGIDKPDSVELYKEYAGIFDEESYGFDNYHPYKGDLTTSEKTVIHKLPENHGYDMAPATFSSYEDSARSTFTDYEDLKVVDEDGMPLVFDYIGKAMDFPLKRQLPYFKYVMPSGEVYLVPYENGDSSTVTEALLSMKKAENDIVKEVIPAGVDYQVTEVDGIAVVSFDSPVDFTTIPQQDVLQMIEGFMLTASNYDVQVQLKNIEQSHFENYDLTKPLPKPVGANPIWLP
ncbi:hypothetical protein QTL97_01420 [Sporosarcina thermotolerans]|uniref:Sigma-X negative effector n=1 Tax=Sporosarcina thermotolerans TaxID=633404 RepID=A0AAW9A4I2_9BACL|nr:hypothetical protein [Sporosarcina thermotolerans]MDW0115595.1 hypothetical protein [Sporosarcina thermotolerans]WHT47105.1 hypothetical protein QNH10_12525 [Sporosarcina thermotolerans]